MDFKTYQKKARETAQYPNLGSNNIYPTLGLVGEAGEVAEKVKKVIRDKNGIFDKESKLGINPSVDGKAIRLPIPELSEERRKDLVKMVKQMSEEGRVRVRSARKSGMDGIKNLKSDNAITEDDQRDMEKEVQTLTDKFVKAIDQPDDNKEKEIMTV